MLADATITTVAAVAAILASLGFGGVVGALATGWLAQKDKFRERTIAACDEFLEKESHAREVLFKAERAATTTARATAVRSPARTAHVV